MMVLIFYVQSCNSHPPRTFAQMSSEHARSYKRSTLSLPIHLIEVISSDSDDRTWKISTQPELKNRNNSEDERFLLCVN